MITLEQITKIINESNEKQTAVLKEDIAAINRRIDNIENRVELIDRDVKVHVEQTRIDVKELIDRVEFLEDEKIKMERREEILVRNIPFLEGENLNGIFNDMCRRLALDIVTPAPLIRRFHPKKAVALDDSADQLNPNNKRPRRTAALYKGKETGSSSSANIKELSAPCILVKFQVLKQKNDFMAAYFKYGQLILKDVGFSTLDRIFVRENLTPRSHTIFRKALTLKKSGAVAKLKTVDGQVIITLQNGNRLIIRSLSDLDHLGTSMVIN